MAKVRMCTDNHNNIIHNIFYPISFIYLTLICYLQVHNIIFFGDFPNDKYVIYLLLSSTLHIGLPRGFPRSFSSVSEVNNRFLYNYVALCVFPFKGKISCGF